MIMDIPVLLVKTWVELFLTADDDEVKKHAENMILTNFGSFKSAIDYIEKFTSKEQKC
jgi:hypothetical protein